MKHRWILFAPMFAVQAQAMEQDPWKKLETMQKQLIQYHKDFNKELNVLQGNISNNLKNGGNQHQAFQDFNKLQESAKIIRDLAQKTGWGLKDPMEDTMDRETFHKLELLSLDRKEKEEFDPNNKTHQDRLLGNKPHMSGLWMPMQKYLEGAKHYKFYETLAWGYAEKNPQFWQAMKNDLDFIRDVIHTYVTLTNDMPNKDSNKYKGTRATAIALATTIDDAINRYQELNTTALDQLKKKLPELGLTPSDVENTIKEWNKFVQNLGILPN